MTRWFAPWYGLDFSIVQKAHLSKPFTLTGEHFINSAQILYTCALKSWDLETRDTSVSSAEINQLKTSILSVLAKTEFDQTMASLVFSDIQNPIADADIRNVIMFFIKDEVEQILNVILPEFKLPQKWFEDPSEFKRYTGVNRSLYPKWRNFAIKILLTSTSDSPIRVIFSTLRNPLSAELKLAMQTTTENPKSKKATEMDAPKLTLFDLFTYLDTQFKFKDNPNQEVTTDDLRKNLLTIISGISDHRDRKVAKLASTWTCESFEEFMKIVTLFKDH
jgi:hypothetical protein